MYGFELCLKQGGVDLDAVCCQGQRSGESLNLTETHLAQASVSLDSNTWPTTTSLPFSAHHHILLCLILSSLSPAAVFRSPSCKIQYLSQTVWVHSPLSLGVLPLALRWISLGLIDITLVMKYAYHDQRWQQQRWHLESLQPGVDVLLETVSVIVQSKDATNKWVSETSFRWMIMCVFMCKRGKESETDNQNIYFPSTCTEYFDLDALIWIWI